MGLPVEQNTNSNNTKGIVGALNSLNLHITEVISSFVIGNLLAT